ncbi:M15 family peptidase [bacterium]|nr:MAG: M15 family peptidase [bacterium]
MKTGQEFPIFQRNLYDLFGEPEEGADYLRTLDFGEFSYAFSHVRDYEGNAWRHKIYGHVLMADPLRKAFGLIVARGLFDELKTFDGCFNIRRMKGSGSMSIHSWGLAVDFNAAENPYGGPVNFSDDFIQCFADCGFEAGALWHTPDGMHFQLPWTQDWRKSDNPLKPVLLEV